MRGCRNRQPGRKIARGRPPDFQENLLAPQSTSLIDIPVFCNESMFGSGYRPKACRPESMPDGKTPHGRWIATPAVRRMFPVAVVLTEAGGETARSTDRTGGAVAGS